MTLFFRERLGDTIPVIDAREVRRSLPEPDIQWVPGSSAFELAFAWVAAGDLPPSVRRVLLSVPAYADIKLTKAVFAKHTDLRSFGGPNDTHLMVYAEVKDGSVVIAVEGKREEGFGPSVAHWKDSVARERRLNTICQTLCVDPKDCQALNYPLLRRTVSALFEAQHEHAKHAMLMVHSFSDKDTGFEAFRAFTATIGAPVLAPNQVSVERVLDGVSLRFAWVRDKASA
jgi:hypothetical protein